ncbi:hypothetical protein [Persephonella sp. IF05-L8]|uniref:hypothetical protein n=1 Tax=Persephonella sp. IF05-L8 TaxID=1158338 RepID=UPI0018CC3538
MEKIENRTHNNSGSKRTKIQINPKYTKLIAFELEKYKKESIIKEFFTSNKSIKPEKPI